MAGANGMMVGNYLTTAGRTKEDDLELINDLGLESIS
jgi:biotin synthase